MMINAFIKTGLGIAVASLISISAFADNYSSPSADQSMSQQNAGRMSAGGGVQPADQYSDGGCKGAECPDEGLEQDNAATDIPDDNTDSSDGAY